MKEEIDAIALCASAYIVSELSQTMTKTAAAVDSYDFN